MATSLINVETKLMLDETLKKLDIDYETYDKCLKAIFHLMCFLKYNRTDHIAFDIDTANSRFDILESTTNESVFFGFGRPAILAAKSSLLKLLNILKTHPKEFDVLISYAMNNQVEDYKTHLKSLSPIYIKSKHKLKNKEPDYHIIESGGSSESDTFCPACEQKPCMCSDPQWRLD